jgi:hypothetical protein
MPRPKRSSNVIEQAQRRLASLQSIDPNLDFGSQLSVADYTEQIVQAQQAIAQYNTLLSQVDEAQKVVEAMEQKVATLSKKLLSSVSIRYGDDSVEYMKAGGTMRGSKRQAAKTLSARLAAGGNDSAPTITPIITTIVSKPVTASSNASMNRNKSGGVKVKG